MAKQRSLSGVPVFTGEPNQVLVDPPTNLGPRYRSSGVPRILGSEGFPGPDVRSRFPPKIRNGVYRNLYTPRKPSNLAIVSSTGELHADRERGHSSNGWSGPCREQKNDNDEPADSSQDFSFYDPSTAPKPLPSPIQLHHALPPQVQKARGLGKAITDPDLGAKAQRRMGVVNPGLAPNGKNAPLRSGADTSSPASRVGVPPLYYFEKTSAARPPQRSQSETELKSVPSPSLTVSDPRSQQGSRFSRSARKLFSALKLGSKSPQNSPTDSRSSSAHTTDSSPEEQLATDESVPPAEAVQLLESLGVSEPQASLNESGRGRPTTTGSSGLTILLGPEAEYLTEHEKDEIGAYERVYYLGAGAEKLQFDFTTEDGNYKCILDDHINYRYRILGLVGCGTFGKVYKCMDYATNSIVAIKITVKRNEMKRQARVEAGILVKLKKQGSPHLHHVLNHLTHFEFRTHFCLVTELLGPSMYDLLKMNGFNGLGTPFVRHVSRQLVEALEFLDIEGVIHCDIKPENVLVSDVDLCQVKLIDFGSGCHESKRLFTYIQSRYYRAPEVLLGSPYTQAIDIWSFGCVVAELLVGKPIFPGENEADQVACLCMVLGVPGPEVIWTFNRSKFYFDRNRKLVPNSKAKPRGFPGSLPFSRLLMDKDAVDFVEKLVVWSPQKRLSAGGARYHPFVQNI